ncbi:hypothetical protein SAMD00019534_050100, partial [Acytostelium subglobosum LB1]|uniref:hypothetical protein n=1 Tax=Acytostelium subglobosum LB1 TaxID=1410327 RepID=UPI0006449BA9
MHNIDDINNITQYQSLSIGLVDRLKRDTVQMLNKRVAAIPRSDMNGDGDGDGDGEEDDMSPDMLYSTLDSGGCLQLLMQLSQIDTQLEQVLERQRTTVDDEKRRSEHLDNTLNALAYEKDTVQSQLTQLEAALPFDINDQRLNLSSESHFLSDRPSGYHSGHQSNKVIERLEWEMSKRIAKLQELEQMKAKLVDVAAQEQRKAKELADFEAKLKSGNITTAAVMRPIQAHMTIQKQSQPPIMDKHPLLKHAPLPLFILYNELRSFQEVFCNQIDVDLNCTDVATTSTSSQPSILTPSEIYVTLIITSANNNMLTMQFYYYPNLKMVSVVPSMNGNEIRGQRLLESLDPNDKGLITLNASNHFLLGSDEASFTSASHNIKGRPFRWLQHITGLTFLPEITIDDVHNKSFQIHNFKPKTTNDILFDIISNINH